MMPYRRIRYLFYILPCLCFAASLRAQDGIKHTIWDVPGIYRTPAYEVISRDSAVGLIYTGLPYHGHRQAVFAYYATPGMVTGNKKADNGLPAIVLVHGGGGRAFKNWAVMWAKKGYAAIAMDLRGNGPDKTHIPNGFIEKDHETPYFKITPSLYDQWMFQAVADVILAHNLIRHFPAVDSNRTAITGISWGGVITCIVAGLDNRYRAAVPVYGCGYLAESGRMKTRLDALSPGDRGTWIRQYDPSRYVKHARIPVLFLNDADDPYFVLRSYRKTYRGVKNRNLCVKINLKHSHHAGWSNREIYYFINHYINKTPALPMIGSVVEKDHQVTAGVKTTVKIAACFLHYTADAGGEYRNWHTKKVGMKHGKIISPLPPRGTAVWYLSLEDERGLQVSGDIRFYPPGR